MQYLPFETCSVFIIVIVFIYYSPTYDGQLLRDRVGRLFRSSVVLNTIARNVVLEVLCRERGFYAYTKIK